MPTTINKKVLNDVKPIPSIVGNDFLEENNLALFFNPSQKITYLEETVSVQKGKPQAMSIEQKR